MSETSGRIAGRWMGLFRGAVRELCVASARRMPFLDFLRAIAVLLVVNQHAGNAYRDGIAPNAYSGFWLTRNGWMGVDLFFVLSGYFIGSQLWKELRVSGRVSVGRFVLRRGLRIWPLYLFVLGVVLLASHGAPENHHGLKDLLFVTNYTLPGIVKGSWSLATEEQFYLLTPVALLLIGRRSARSYRWGLVGLLAVVVAGRIAAYVSMTGHFFVKDPEAFRRLYYPFHTHCDGLIVGLLLANLAVYGERVWGIWARPRLLAACALAVAFGLYKLQAETMDFLALAVLFGALVWWGRTIQARLFEWHGFYVLSRLSFGMYLNHEYMEYWVARHAAAAVGRHAALGAALGALLLTVISAALAAVTFMAAEHPFLVWRTALLRNKVSVGLEAH